MVTAADHVQNAQRQLDSTLKSMDQLDHILDNVLRYINHPQVTTKSARRRMLDALGLLGHSEQGKECALKTFRVNERLDLLMLNVRNMKDEIEDLVVEIEDIKDRASRWEGNLRG